MMPHIARRAIQFAARLYPAAWRKRYAAEFAALLEDENGGWRTFADVLKGAVTMQMRIGGWWKWVAACGVAGALAAGVAYWQTPKKYVSTAVLKGGADRLQLLQLQQAVLSRTSLENVIIQNELYRDARAEQPIEDIVQDMRMHDIRIRPVSPSAAAWTGGFAISYTAGTPRQAQAVTRALVRQFQTEAAAKGSLELLDPPSLPVQASSPRRDQWIVFGLLLGLLAGVAVVGTRRWPWVAASAVTGALIGAGISLAMPKVYISTAIVMGDAAQHGAALIDDSMMERLLEDPVLNLYADRRGRLTPAQLAQQLRNNIIVQAVQPPPNGKSSAVPATRISFRYSDRFKAQAVIRQLVAQFTRAGDGRSRVYVLDAPSQPDQPFRPMLRNWSLAGLFAGLLCGISLTLLRRRPPAAARPEGAS